MTVVENGRGENIEKQGVIFVLIRDKKIQLERRKNPNKSYYGFDIIPGGGVEPYDKSIKMALEREVREEYGVQVMTSKELGIIVSKERGVVHTRHVFLVTSWFGELSNPENADHIEASYPVAKMICAHPTSQRILDLVGRELFGDDPKRINCDSVLSDFKVKMRPS